MSAGKVGAGDKWGDQDAQGKAQDREEEPNVICEAAPNLWDLVQRLSRGNKIHILPGNTTDESPDLANEIKKKNFFFIR